MLFGSTKTTIERTDWTGGNYTHPSSVIYAPRAPVRALVHQRPHTELSSQVWIITMASSGGMQEYTKDR